ncbi:MAG: sodium:solute symporter [Sedimentisphaerales bacterium]|nr:sodium:solute symporter [Sedimentisphaerales bacterium]
MLASTINISGMDLFIIVAYLVFVVGLGCWSGLRNRKDSEGKDYFLAGRTLRWHVIGLALFSTNISTVHLVSLAEQGYKNGLAYGNFEWMAAFTLILLALFFAPFYIRARVSTLPDFLEKRYNKACRNWLAGMSIVSAIFIHIGFSLYAGAVVLRGLFGINIWTSIIVTAVLTGVYTIIGGLMAVVITESVQTIILLTGAICLTVISYVKAGGWGGIAEMVEPVKLTVLRPHGDASGLPWYAVFLGYPIIGIWYWCTDQTIVQRVLGAKDENHARVGALFAGFIKILPVFIFVFPGLICLALIRQGAVPGDLTDPADTYSFMITHLLPKGLTGIVAAALLAALMSTVSGALNSIATLFSFDLYKQLRPHTPNEKLVFVGRIVTFIGMLLAIAWSPLVGRYETIFDGIIAMICYLSPPITVVFMAGVFWKRATSGGAFAALIVGSLLGLIVFFLDLFKEATGWNIPSMMASFYLAVICSIVLIVVSLLRPEDLTTEKTTLIWDRPLDCLKARGWPGIGDYRVLSAILFVVMVVLYILFS